MNRRLNGSRVSVVDGYTVPLAQSHLAYRPWKSARTEKLSVDYPFMKCLILFELLSIVFSTPDRRHSKSTHKTRTCQWENSNNGSSEDTVPETALKRGTNKYEWHPVHAYCMYTNERQHKVDRGLLEQTVTKRFHKCCVKAPHLARRKTLMLKISLAINPKPIQLSVTHRKTNQHKDIKYNTPTCKHQAKCKN